MNIKDIDKRGPAYGSFLYISCRKCGEIPQSVEKYSDDGKSFENTIPDDWVVEIDTKKQRITNVICPECSRFLKLDKIKNVLKRNRR
jgi:hypothetical protein